MKTKFKILLSCLLIVPFFVSAATTDDFIANGNIVVSSVSFNGGTADMIIFDTSRVQSWSFSGGVFTVLNPDATSGTEFKVGSSNVNVASIKSTKTSDGTSVCSVNTTPGTTQVTLLTDADTYTIEPFSNSNCTNGTCGSVTNAATLNAYPTCGAATCNSGYILIGSGSSAVCNKIVGGGGIFTGGVSSLTTPATVVPQTPAAPSAPATVAAPSVANPSYVAQTVSPVFNVNLKYGVTSSDVRRLQNLLASDAAVYPEGRATGYFGPATRNAVQRFQKKYGVAKEGDTGYGIVGPNTRAKIQEVFGQTSASQSTAGNQAKILELMAQIKQLQELLKALQNR